VGLPFSLRPAVLRAWLRSDSRSFHRFRSNLRNQVYGSTDAREFLYKKRYREHVERVQQCVPPDRLLVMDITAGEGWEKLCPFLGLPHPGVAFPFENRTPGTAG
jgi:hypothetical protein